MAYGVFHIIRLPKQHKISNAILVTFCIAELYFTHIGHIFFIENYLVMEIARLLFLNTDHFTFKGHILHFGSCFLTECPFYIFISSTTMQLNPLLTCVSISFFTSIYSISSTYGISLLSFAIRLGDQMTPSTWSSITSSTSLRIQNYCDFSPFLLGTWYSYMTSQWIFSLATIHL